MLGSIAVAGAGKVSAALGRLRLSLGDPLFVRHGQRMVATDYARSLARPLREVLDRLEALLSGPEAFDPFEATQVFRISGSDFFAEMLMPQLAERLSRLAPGMRVHALIKSVAFDRRVLPRGGGARKPEGAGETRSPEARG